MEAYLVVRRGSGDTSPLASMRTEFPKTLMPGTQPGKHLQPRGSVAMPEARLFLNKPRALLWRLMQTPKIRATRAGCWPSPTPRGEEQTRPWRLTNPEKHHLLTLSFPKRCCHLGGPLTKSRGTHFSWFWSNCSYFIYLSSAEMHNCFAASVLTIWILYSSTSPCFCRVTVVFNICTP